MNRAWLLSALLLISPLAGADEPVHERVLDNGLKVIVKEDHRAPIVTSQVWYKVGSSYEQGGTTGISHALEHMMFQGTDKLAPGEFSRIIAENGGDENAFTSRDYTAYFENLARDRLPIAFELEADRMRHLALPAEEFDKELEVVKEERRLRTEDDPESLTFEVFNSVAYAASPYRSPVIGWADDIAGLTVTDLRDWYRQWYAPNNATLVVVGDVEPDAVFTLAERYFGPLAAEDVAAARPRTEPPQRGEKRVSVKVPAKEPYLLMGYKATAVGHAETAWEPYALEMLASVLDGGASARIKRDLVRGQEIAASAGAGYSAFSRLPGMLLLDGVPAKGHDVADLERALREQIARLRDEPVGADELARIRNQLVAAKVFKLDSVFYQGMEIGQLESIGLGWQLIDEYLDRLNAVTPEQIQAVARKYLVPDNLTVAVLDPQPLDGRPSPIPAGGHLDVR
ncbi:putative Zn-dependent peptidase [Thioflavicoccus mobilis 8321]|uniref:Putative Zn-dependent peptidase n=1 Tax=Thioflavicoccus mobilis 8321 TaxID=765912 RepID=L0H3V9_9GAMM|nr:pitrilysin family protein [Thioflavicoccus mobilis]AGA92279.1 putative Zn-dependent peptidase [Thioflavicoccus mobilis 8321]